MYPLAHGETHVMSLPIGITVEGANIMTRSFMCGYRKIYIDIDIYVYVYMYMLSHIEREM